MEVRVLKSDGEVYRRWQTTVESVAPTHVVTVDNVGEPVAGPGGGWRTKFASRTTYWRDKPYNLVEMYEVDGKLKEIYIHIASFPKIDAEAIEFVDYELDVVKKRGQIRVRDQDEFEHAASQYGYSAEHCESCAKAVEEAIRLASSWRPAGPPRRGR